VPVGCPIADKQRRRATAQTRIALMFTQNTQL
jgi:hypothetical protein